MISSTSSSSRLVAAAVALLAMGCAGPRAEGTSGEASRARPKVLVLPPDNLTGGPLPIRELTERLDLFVAMAGADVVGGDRLEEYLARYRIRYTGGIDRVAARAAREDLGADAVLLTTIELTRQVPPKLALTIRLTGTGDDLPVLWMDGYARAGDDRPGLLSLGLVQEFQMLQADAFQVLGTSLEGYLRGRSTGRVPCTGGGWFRPRIAYRARPDEREVATVAVLPFLNETRRRGAGEIVALGMARQVASTGRMRLLEPGVVRDELLRRRIVMEDGVSLDQARTLSATLEADLVVAGYVFEYDDSSTIPASNFTVQVIDRRTGRVVWESISYNRGTDSETLFGLNRVSTPSLLTCRMAQEVLETMSGRRQLAGP